jgi:hypothetical protein
MLSFLGFLAEAAAGADADSSGKAFELEFARHLHPEGKLPEHFNDESGRTPHQVSADLQGKLGHDAYSQISAHAKQAAEAHKTASGHNDIAAVHWTSQAGQVSKLTKQKEDENPSDVVYTRKNGEHHGVSLKYGRAVGSRSPGMADLARMSGVHHEEIAKMQRTHDAAIDTDMQNHIADGSRASRHQQYKDIVNNGSPGAQAAAKRAAETSRAHQGAIASRIASGLSNVAATDHEAMKKVVRRLGGAPEAVTPMFKVHHNPVSNSTDTSVPTEDFDKLEARTHHYSVSHNGASISIHAHDAEGNKIGTVVRTKIKNKSSSPYTNMTGSSALGNAFKNLKKGK